MCSLPTLSKSSHACSTKKKQASQHPKASSMFPPKPQRGLAYRTEPWSTHSHVTDSSQSAQSVVIVTNCEWSRQQKEQTSKWWSRQTVGYSIATQINPNKRPAISYRREGKVHKCQGWAKKRHTKNKTQPSCVPRNQSCDSFLRYRDQQQHRG